jgi:hypothetical protein
MILRVCLLHRRNFVLRYCRVTQKISEILYKTLCLSLTNVKPSYLRHVIAATQADQYRHLHRSNYTKTLIYEHTT